MILNSWHGVTKFPKEKINQARARRKLSTTTAAHLKYSANWRKRCYSQPHPRVLRMSRWSHNADLYTQHEVGRRWTCSKLTTPRLPKRSIFESDANTYCYDLDISAIVPVKQHRWSPVNTRTSCPWLQSNWHALQWLDRKRSCRKLLSSSLHPEESASNMILCACRSQCEC